MNINLLLLLMKWGSQVLLAVNGIWALFSEPVKKKPWSDKKEITPKGWCQISGILIGLILFGLSQYCEVQVGREKAYHQERDFLLGIYPSIYDTVSASALSSWDAIPGFQRGMSTNAANGGVQPLLRHYVDRFSTMMDKNRKDLELDGLRSRWQVIIALGTYTLAEHSELSFEQATSTLTQLRAVEADPKEQWRIRFSIAALKTSRAFREINTWKYPNVAQGEYERIVNELAEARTLFSDLQQKATDTADTILAINAQLAALRNYEVAKDRYARMTLSAREVAGGMELLHTLQRALDESGPRPHGMVLYWQLLLGL